jgi:ribonucleotide reductase alpha subunit
MQQSFKSLHPVIPIVPRPVRKAQASVQQLLHDASDLDPITYFILLQEMILDHLAQMLLCEENRHCTSVLYHRLLQPARRQDQAGRRPAKRSRLRPLTGRGLLVANAWGLIPIRAHLEMQACLQPFVDNSISKTINVPESCPFAEFRDIYDLAYDKGLKGCTTFRPNPVTGTVLSEEDAGAKAAHCCVLEREPD